MPDKSKVDLWLDRGLTLRDRHDNPPVTARSNVSTEKINEKIERGDIGQELRLRYYPSVYLTSIFKDLYVGSIEATLDQAEEMLYEIGYRNNPTAYVEYTEQQGPDDGSYAKHTITESQEFPYLGIGRPFGLVTWWNRVKEQVHVTTFMDGDMIHFAAHKEASAWLQPVRHATVSSGDADIGVREFSRDWEDNYETELQKVL